VVLELEVLIQGSLQRPHAGRGPAAELHAPQLGKDGALRALDEAVRPGLARWVRVCGIL
jgi:hypothetical protein